MLISGTLSNLKLLKLGRQIILLLLKWFVLSRKVETSSCSEELLILIVGRLALGVF